MNAGRVVARHPARSEAIDLDLRVVDRGDPVGQAKPTSMCGNATPLSTRGGAWLARLIRACHTHRPASKFSIPNSPWKLVISVAPQTLAPTRQARAAQKECEPVHKFGFFCGTAPAGVRRMSISADVRCQPRRPRHHRSTLAPATGSASRVPVVGKCEIRPGQLVVVGGARLRGTWPCLSDADGEWRGAPCADSGAAEMNKDFGSRRSGNVVIQHDLSLNAS